ncbi:MAG: hypothetical protein M3Y54_00260 [Bacteroidota bacterium]|nr:hypothetical protein [Bacteroidota bacterium]
MQYFDMLRPARRLLLALLGLLLSRAADAQLPISFSKSENTATVAECITVLAGDSTVLYYDLRYNLTPPACASIRRHTHVTPTGDFRGEVRDYTIDNGQLRSRLYYDNGQRHGRYETYYPNGQLAIRGSFAQGEPTGTWEFWYANGQRQQTFEWTGVAAPRLRIMAYWDSTGQAGVSNGNGRWQGVMRQPKRRYGGPVLNGLPQGIWESHQLGSEKLVTTETYEQGIFRGGRALSAPPGMPSRYKTYSLLEPDIEDPTAWGDHIRLGLNCAGLLANTRHRAEVAAGGSTANAAAHLEPPRPPMEEITYMQKLLDRLYQSNRREEWENIVDGQVFTLLATVDPEGVLRVASGQGGSGIMTAVTHALDGMGRWHPAQAYGKPTAGVVRFSIVKMGVQLNIRWQLAVQPGPLPPNTGSKGPG